MKILIATPAYAQQVNNEMVLSLIRAIEHLRSNNHSVNWYSPSSSILSFNRNLACDVAIKEGYDWLLFWDGDISVDEPDFIEKMSDLGHKTTGDIIGLPVVLKGEPKTYNCAFKGIDSAEGYINYNSADNPLRRDPFEVDVIGTGVMMIWVNALKKITPPYFFFIDTHKEKAGFFPEDWNFCERMTDVVGTKIIADPRFRVSHWGIKEFV